MRDIEEVEFTVKCKMRKCWAAQFLGMLKHMQMLGSIGSSREVTLFADGDGDFRPKFEWDEGLPVGDPVKNVDDKAFFDAG